MASTAARGQRRAANARSDATAPRKRAPHIHRRQTLAALFAGDDDGADEFGAACDQQAPVPNVDARFISDIVLHELYEPAPEHAQRGRAPLGSLDDMSDEAREGFLHRMRSLGETWHVDSQSAPTDASAAGEPAAWLARTHRHNEPPPAPPLPEAARTVSPAEGDSYHECVVLALLGDAHRRYLAELPAYDACEQFFLPVMCDTARQPYRCTLARFDARLFARIGLRMASVRIDAARDTLSVVVPLDDRDAVYACAVFALEGAPPPASDGGGGGGGDRTVSLRGAPPPPGCDGDLQWTFGASVQLRHYFYFACGCDR